MKLKNSLFLALALLLITVLAGVHEASAQTNDAKIHGRLIFISGADNALIVKLQAKAIHNYDALKTLMLTNSSLWVRYNDSIVSFAETPVPSTDSTLTDGDYYYPSAAFSSPNYTKKIFDRQTLHDSIKYTSQYAISHVVWEGWKKPGWPGNVVPGTDADVVNEWIDVAFIKLAIIKTGEVQLKWGVGFFEDEILDENRVSYEIDEASFKGLKQYVTFIEPVLELSSTGNGVIGDPYTVKIKSTDANTWSAGTAGFHVYYNSEEASYISSTKLLENAPFGWGAGTIVDKSISELTNGARTEVYKGGYVYDRRITYTNNDATQSDDIWPAKTSTPINALSILFEHKTSEMWTFLETIDNQRLFKNYTETLSYTSIVINPSRALGVVGGSPSVLPVTLTSFTASLNKENVLLKWKTATELNNNSFVIERSINGRIFEAIGTVKGHGTSNTLQTYSFTDTKAVAGIAYYRLKQIDFNGIFEYSGVVSVNKEVLNAITGIIAAYPNPFNDEVNMSYNAPSTGKTSISIYNNVGKLVKTQEIEVLAGENTVSLSDLANIPAGIYMLRINNGLENSSYKLIKSK